MTKPSFLISNIDPQEVLPVSERGLLIVVSGPSGVGKSTIKNAMLEQLEAIYSVSMTTRQRTGEDVPGVDYFFVSDQQFKQAIEDDAMLEWAEVFGHLYGTPKAFVQNNRDRGRDVILEIDVNGAIDVRANRPDALMIFILPPSEEELLGRLRKRAREDEPTIQKRFAEAKREIKQAQDSGAYDHFITNHNLEQAIDEAVRFVRQHKASLG